MIAFLFVFVQFLFCENKICPVSPTDLNECDSKPCLHDGVCKDGINSYTCDCSETGYEGEVCKLGEPFVSFKEIILKK